MTKGDRCVVTMWCGLHVSSHKLNSYIPAHEYTFSLQIAFFTTVNSIWLPRTEDLEKDHPLHLVYMSCTCLVHVSVEDGNVEEFSKVRFRQIN